MEAPEMTAATVICEPGAYDLSDAKYRADPCPEPSLSSSVAKLLLARSPRHAWCAHPRLNPDFQPKADDKFDLGSAAHDMLLRGGDAIRVIDAPDWTSKPARTAREEARQAGLVPMLAPHYERVTAMVRAAREQLANHPDAAGAFTNGLPEITLIWREKSAGIWCRAKLDWQPNKGKVFDDYKTTSASAWPGAWSRTAFGIGADIQAAFYRRGIRAVLGIANPTFRFVVQEAEPPYALSVMEFGAEAMELADRKVEEAIRLWATCLKSGSWPGYPARVASIDLPAWQASQFAEREYVNQTAIDAGPEMHRFLLDWQAPLFPKKEIAR